MRKSYHNNSFFAKPCKCEYPYENFNETPPCPLMNVERNFCPMMQRNLVFQNDFNSESEYNPNLNCRYNYNVYGNTPYEDNFSLQGMRNFNPENFGPMIMAMPVLIDFDDDDD